MKIFLLVVALAGMTWALKAQQTPHTLQYSRTLLISSAGGTVPAAATNNGVDCVWKVVSVLPGANVQQNVSGYTGNNMTIGSFTILVNSDPVYLSKVDAAFGYDGYEGTGNGDIQYNFANVNGELLPMWLPAGTTLAAGSNIQYISVIEFIVN